MAEAAEKVLGSVEADCGAGPPVGEEKELAVNAPDEVVVDFPEETPIVGADEQEEAGLEEVHQQTGQQEVDKEKDVDSRPAAKRTHFEEKRKVNCAELRALNLLTA